MTVELNKESVGGDGALVPAPEIDNGPRPAPEALDELQANAQIDRADEIPKESDKVQVEAEIQRDIELRFFQARRIGALFKIELAKNMGNNELLASAQADLAGIEAAVTESVKAAKENIRLAVDKFVSLLDEALQHDDSADQSYTKRIANISRAEMMYLVHMIGKETAETPAPVPAVKMWVPLTNNGLGCIVYLAWNEGGLWLCASKLPKKTE